MEHRRNFTMILFCVCLGNTMRSYLEIGGHKLEMCPSSAYRRSDQSLKLKSISLELSRPGLLRGSLCIIRNVMVRVVAI